MPEKNSSFDSVSVVDSTDKSWPHLVTVIPEEEPEEEEEEEEEAREEIAVDCGVRAVGIVAVDGEIEDVMISD